MSSPARSRPARRRRFAPVFAIVLVAALVALQALGAMHRIAHGHASIAGRGAADVQTASAAAGESGWLERLFSGHAPHGQGCDDYDQASHGDLIDGVASLDAPAPPPAAAPSPRHAAWHLAAQARGCLARGPPTLA